MTGGGRKSLVTKYKEGKRKRRACRVSRKCTLRRAKLRGETKEARIFAGGEKRGERRNWLAYAKSEEGTKNKLRIKNYR